MEMKRTLIKTLYLSLFLFATVFILFNSCTKNTRDGIFSEKALETIEESPSATRVAIDGK